MVELERIQHGGRVERAATLRFVDHHEVHERSAPRRDHQPGAVKQRLVSVACLGDVALADGTHVLRAGHGHRAYAVCTFFIALLPLSADSRLRATASRLAPSAGLIPSMICTLASSTRLP